MTLEHKNLVNMDTEKNLCFGLNRCFFCYKIGSELPRDTTLRQLTTPSLGKRLLYPRSCFLYLPGTSLITIKYASLEHPLKKESRFVV